MSSSTSTTNNRRRANAHPRASALNKKKVPLPSWAKQIPTRRRPQSWTGVEPLSAQEEEAYLRTQCYHTLSRKLDSALHEAMEQCAEAALGSVRRLVMDDSDWKEDEAVEPDSTASAETKGDLCKETSPNKRLRVDESSSFVAPLIVSARRDPTLLPVLILQGPFSTLDANYWRKLVVSHSQKVLPRTCVVDILLDNLAASCQEAIVSQCCKPNNKSSTPSSCTDRLLEWASTTQDFDRLSVVLQVQTQEEADSELPAVVRWLSELRAHEGLPVSLVLLGPPNVDWARQLASTACAIHRATLPDAKSVLDTLGNLLDNSFPLSSVLTTVLRQQFDQVHGSAMQVVRQLKQVHAYYFSINKGSFWNVDDLLPRAMDRLLAEWFLVDPKGRCVVMGEATSLAEARKWQGQQQTRRKMVHVAVKLLQALGPSDTPAMLRDGLADQRPLTTQERCDMLEHLSSQLELTADTKDDPLVPFLHELIVLVDRCASVEQASAVLQSILNNQIDSLAELSSPLDDSSVLSSLSVFARRRVVVDGLLTANQHEGSDDTTLPSVWQSAGQLYDLMRDLTIIPQDEWFQALGQSREVFACGVLALKVAGLVQEKRVGRGPIQYEKTALVGCS